MGLSSAIFWMIGLEKNRDITKMLHLTLHLNMQLRSLFYLFAESAAEASAVETSDDTPAVRRNT